MCIITYVDKNMETVDNSSAVFMQQVIAIEMAFYAGRNQL
jgi:hypothetical protein